MSEDLDEISKKWVKLNVGGKLFMTSKSTLLSRDSSSMLARMFADEWSTLKPSIQDSSGAFLIDRSYQYFEPILNYLRTGEVIIDHHINIQGVLEEAKYYRIDSMIKKLEEKIRISNIAKDPDPPLNRQQVVSHLLTTVPKQELRFQGVNFRGIDLSKLDLRNINFKYADLSDSNLSGANLSGCCFERANLSNSTLDGAQLINVKMLCANLENSSLKSCNFEDPACNRATCEGVNLKGANLEGSMMAGVNLRVATLKHANLKSCDLRGAVLAGADLEGCDLSGSDLQEANLRGANLVRAAFELMQTPLHMSQTCDL